MFFAYTAFSCLNVQHSQICFIQTYQYRRQVLVVVDCHPLSLATSHIYKASQQTRGY